MKARGGNGGLEQRVLTLCTYQLRDLAVLCEQRLPGMLQQAEQPFCVIGTLTVCLTSGYRREEDHCTCRCTGWKRPERGSIWHFTNVSIQCRTGDTTTTTCTGMENEHLELKTQFIATEFLSWGPFLYGKKYQSARREVLYANVAGRQLIQYLCVFTVFFVSSKSTALRASWILLQFNAFWSSILNYRCCPLQVITFHITT